MNIEISDKETTALSLLIGLRQKFAIEKKQVYNQGLQVGALSVSQSGIIPYLDNSSGEFQVKTLSFQQLKDNWCGE